MAYFFRADLSNFIDHEYPQVVKIRSAGELHRYYESNKETYQFNHGYYSESNMADFVFGDAGGFNDAFFKTRFLLFVILQESSGSVRHRVESAMPENGSLLVSIVRIAPEIGTCDIAQWHIILDLDKSFVDMDVDVVIDTSSA